MAINDTKKVDFLWKKLGYGVAKTDEANRKSASNESIPSPLLVRGDQIWIQSHLIPTVRPDSTTDTVTIYTDDLDNTVECSADATSTPSRTWKTELSEWIPSEFGPTYTVKVYVDDPGSANPQSTGTRLFPDGTGDDEWYFDYSAGILHFIGDSLPDAVQNGKSVYISGARYSGASGLEEFDLDNVFGKGGFREVADISERDAISLDLRIDGMLVYVQDQDRLYKLENGLENSNWVDFDIDALFVNYDNSNTTLTSDNVQDAVDELATSVHTFKTKSVSHTLTGGVTGTVTVTQGDDVTVETTVEYAENSFSVGPTEKTQKPHSFVTGTYNIAKADSVMEVGIGVDETSKQNAFEISESGVVSAPAMTDDMITQDGDLTTKHYIDYLVIDCGSYDQ